MLQYIDLGAQRLIGVIAVMEPRDDSPKAAMWSVKGKISGPGKVKSRQSAMRG